MPVNALDHVNIVVADLDAAAQFYAELLSLERRDAPAPLSPRQAQWMFDANGRAIIHLNALDCPRSVDRDMSPGPTGSLHHVAFNCSGYAEMLQKVAERGLPHHSSAIGLANFKQIFVHDPHGVLLELNFVGE